MGEEEFQRRVLERLDALSEGQAESKAFQKQAETFQQHVTARLDAIVVRLDEQDDAIDGISAKMDRLRAVATAAPEASEQALNGLMETRRRVTRLEGHGPAE